MAMGTWCGDSREQVPRLSQDVEILERLKIARRVDAGGVGPRALALHEARNELLVANYFSDAVAVLDAESGAVKATIPLGAPPETTLWRKGHALFNDARICYQNWGIYILVEMSPTRVF